MQLSDICITVTCAETDRGGGLLDLDDQRLLRALVPGNNMLVARSPSKFQVHTDLELVQALQSLRCACCLHDDLPLFYPQHSSDVLFGAPYSVLNPP